MKCIFLSATFLCFGTVCAPAQTPADKPADLTTLSGKTYRSYCTTLDAAAARQVHN